MATELSIETNAKKIQTLTKVAKLLRDQIQELNKKIDNIQVEIIRIEEHLEKISKPGLSPLAFTKGSNGSVTTSSTQDQSFQKELQLPGIEKLQDSPVVGFSDKSSNDKEQLLKALRTIDEL